MFEIPKKAMNIIVDLLTLTPAFFTSARQLYEVVEELIEEAEKEFNQGETKKESVLNALRALCNDKGVDWEDVYEALSDLIEVILQIKGMIDE